MKTKILRVILALSIFISTIAPVHAAPKDKISNDSIFMSIFAPENAIIKDYETGEKTAVALPSNAHFADYAEEGFWFIWGGDKDLGKIVAAKQKDTGYAVLADFFFEKYESLTITVKSTNEYRNVTFTEAGTYFIDQFVYKNEKKGADGGYQNINWIGLNLKEKEQKEDDVCELGRYVTEMFSTPIGDYGIPWFITELGQEIWQNEWGKTDALKNSPAEIIWKLNENNEVKAEPKNGDLQLFTFDYFIPGNKIIGGEDFYIAADNGFIMLINDNIVGTSYHFDTEGLGFDIDKIMNDVDTDANLDYLFVEKDWTPEGWSPVYKIDFDDIKDYFVAGENNTIKIIAWNSHDGEVKNGEYNTNPAGLIFTGKVESEGECLGDEQYGALEVDASATLYTKKDTILELWQKEVTPFRTVTTYVSPKYDSVTATNPGNPKIVKNSNHFTYAKLAVADLVDGVELDLVEGNKINKVGTALVKIVNGKLEISFNDLHSFKEYGAVAFTNLPEVKNGNIHSEKVFSHNNKSLIDLPVADNEGNIYLYLHSNGMQFVLDTDVFEETKVTKENTMIFDKVIKSKTTKTELEVTVELYDSEDNLIDPSDYDRLVPGMYTIVYSNEKETTSETIEIIAGETLGLYYAKEYFEDATPKIITRQLKDIVHDVVISNIVVQVKK